jgi:hypothetical protein
MIPSLRLKDYMIKWIMIGSLGFAITKMVEFGLAN